MIKKEDDYSTFHLAFVGELVSITTNITGQMTQSTDAGIITESFPVFYEGILLDEDENYYYLGIDNDPIEITQAVRKSIVVHIMISSEKSEEERILDSLATPKRREEIN